MDVVEGVEHPAIECAIEQADALADELDAEVCVVSLAGRDIVLLARRGPQSAGTSLGFPGDRTPLLAPVGAVFMAWAEDDDAVNTWLERASLDAQLEDHYRRLLGDIRKRGFSVPLPAIVTPMATEAIARLREEPSDDDAERQYAAAFKDTDEFLLSFDDLSPAEEIAFKAVSAPIFDPMGRVLLALSITSGAEAVPVRRILELGRRVVQSASIATREARGRIPMPDE